MLAVASIPALGQAQVSAGNNGITIRTNDDNFTLHIGLDIQIGRPFPARPISMSISTFVRTSGRELRFSTTLMSSSSTSRGRNFAPENSNLP
jgi:hypothetical protein